MPRLPLTIPDRFHDFEAAATEYFGITDPTDYFRGWLLYMLDFSGI